jgi:hypothetical protein
MTTKKRLRTKGASNPPHSSNDGVYSAALPLVGGSRPTPAARGISDSVRRIIVQRPNLTLNELSVALVEFGWNQVEVDQRQSTIATLRSDALSILSLARQHGWVVNRKTGAVL